MKALILLLTLTIGSSHTWADSLLSYIEMPVASDNLLAFSSQGIQFKSCNTCDTIKLQPAPQVAYYKQNQPIDIKQATQLYLKNSFDSVSIFYNRKTNTYDKVVFGGHIEIEPIQPHPNFQ